MRYLIIFRKAEGARLLSHLDLMATFEYGLRRARLPVELSEGFNPRPRMSIAAPLPVGYVGEAEVLEIELREEMPGEAIVRQLGSALPGGIEIVSAEPVPRGRKSAARLRAAGYRVDLPAPLPGLPARISALVESGDLTPVLLSLDAPDDRTIRIRVPLGDAGLRPERVLDALGIPQDGARIVRERIEIDPD